MGALAILAAIAYPLPGATGVRYWLVHTATSLLVLAVTLWPARLRILRSLAVEAAGGAPSRGAIAQGWLPYGAIDLAFAMLATAAVTPWRPGDHPTWTGFIAVPLALGGWVYCTNWVGARQVRRVRRNAPTGSVSAR